MARKKGNKRPKEGAESVGGPPRQLVAQNRKARHRFRVEEKFEAGIELRGAEVKSLRARQVDFTDSYCRIFNGQALLVGLHLGRYAHATSPHYEPARPRRLLLHRREIRRLAAKVQQQGYTIVPWEIYFRRGWAKVELALVRGKTFRDVRETLKERQAVREISRVRKGRER